MDRLYGIIKDTETAKTFINDLYDATTTEENGGPVTMLSDYISVPSMSSMNSLFNKLSRMGIATATMTDEARQIVLDILTRDQITNASSGQMEVTSFDTVACIGEGIYLVIKPNYEGTTAVGVLMSVVHIYTYDDGGTATTGYTVVDLRHPNDNGAAPALAYEITPTKSGDALVKIASCVLDCTTDEDRLRQFFSTLNIFSYEVIKPQGSPPSGISCVKSHSAAYFGASGSKGGFVLHAMHTDKSKYGLTIFNTDGTPLFTWVTGCKPFNTLTEDQEKFMYVIDPVGRNISEARHNDEDPESDRVIEMGVLAPIFCPSYDDRAEWAKWMQQGPHNYSYFDRSGHIRLRSNMSSSETVFLMDYGVALWDGTASEYSASDKSAPDIDPRNMSTYERPDIEIPLPNSEHMYAYFDSLAGLDDQGWMNFRDPANDMIFSSTPNVRNDDGMYCRFTNGASGYNVGYFNSKYGETTDTHAGCSKFIVFRYSFNGTNPSGWKGGLFGDIFSDETLAAIHSVVAAAMHMMFNKVTANSDLSYTDGYTENDYHNVLSGASQNKWYILCFGGGQNQGNSDLMYLYDADYTKSGDTITPILLTSNSPRLSYALKTQLWPSRFYLGCYPGNDPSWKTRIDQGQFTVSPWTQTWPSGSDASISVDVKFIAFGRQEDTGYTIQDSAYRTRCVQYLAERFGNDITNNS